MKRYDSYKDTGIAWIGEIPSHWERKRIKFLLSYHSDGIWGNEEKGNANDIPCIRIADFIYDRMTISNVDLTLRNFSDEELEGRKIKKGDLLIEKSGGGESTPVGRIVIANNDSTATCSNFIHFIRIKSEYNNTFLCYHFNALYANKVNLLYFNQTTGIQNLQIPKYLGQQIFLPPLKEQEAIADYLDRKCASIDGIIATQERRIALLNELKQSVITEAVTRGTNPDAPLRDSGIDWIGLIPEHWEVMKMNYTCSVITDFVASGSFADLRENVEYIDDPDYAMLIRTADLSNKNAGIQKVYVSKESYEFLNNSNLFGGEIILPNIGASIGDVYIVPDNMYPKMTLAPNSIMVKSKWNNKFLFYFFSSKAGRESLNLIGTAAAQGKFNKTELRALKVPIPPSEEQNDIVSYIESRIQPLDSALAKAKREIELLKEYKQSVITEAVTGKIKVC